MSNLKTKPVTRSLTTETEIAAPLDAVWKALTETEELTRWFPLEAGKNPDGTLWMSWRNEFKWDSRIEIAEPPHHFRYTTVETLTGEEQPSPRAQEKPAAPPVTATDFYLETRSGKTALRLVHSGFSVDSEWDDFYDGVRRGWDFQLWSLRHYLENHRGTPRRTAYVRTFLKNFSRQQAWQRLFGPQMLAPEGRFENLNRGDRYALRSATGDHFTGVVQTFDPPREFSATAENFNNAILEVHSDELFGYRDLNIFLFTYGVPAEEVAAVETRLRVLFGREIS